MQEEDKKYESMQRRKLSQRFQNDSPKEPAFVDIVCTKQHSSMSCMPQRILKQLVKSSGIKIPHENKHREEIKNYHLNLRGTGFDCHPTKSLQ